MQFNVYGVDLSCAKFRDLPEFMLKYTPDVYRNFKENITEEYGEDIFQNAAKLNEVANEWLNEYTNIKLFSGVSAYLADTINMLEGVALSSCDNNCDVLCILPQFPWKFNEKVRNFSEEDFNDMIRKYLSQICDEALPIDYMVLDF